VLEKVKDRIGDQRGGSKWEPIKILSQKNSAYIPIATLRVSHEQVGEHMNLSRDLRNKACRARKQSGSRHERARATKRKTETYQIIRPQTSGSTHPLRVSRPQVSGSPGIAQKTVREFSPNFRSMDLPSLLKSFFELKGSSHNNFIKNKEHMYMQKKRGGGTKG
jgi:hypothetical protein